MISRFHALLELACRVSGGRVELEAFRQGPSLHQSLTIPAVSYNPRSGSWTELLDEERVPHRPDALFTLRFPHDPQGNNRAYFFYEADRKTTNTTRFIPKLRSHFHFVAKQRLHQKCYQIPRIRAVLIETLDTSWAETLRQVSKHSIVCGNKPTPLFWFTSSSFFTSPVEMQIGNRTRTVPMYQAKPEIVLDKIWASPTSDMFLSLLD